FWLRAARHGARFLHVPRVFATYRWHAASKTLELSEALRAERRRLIQRETGWPASGRWADMVLATLNVAYRLRRQWLKLLKGLPLDWRPTHWRMKRYKRALDD